MKYLKFKVFALFLALTTLTGCLSDDENYCSQTIYPFVSNVTGPETALTGEEIVLNVSFPIVSNCATFVGFQQNNVFPRNIYPAVQYEGCQCSGTTSTQTEEYTFSADEPGEYELKFANGTTEDNSQYTYITKTITVSDPD
ncbi:hypothetical protein FUA48_10455 [Flavobacterium alkalisoli]|uniref:Uncharacterized protein n=1 Tax=Flavobacterium alkalisoli TaxID=2602769 RepID=A0A5B9FSS6_9FLAO|nr:hypothetical protein [Flavobacterium alkalisoli]QEE49985.1 hypothetical protein FUA48_10455 [Flavobacterium alkalisoli]